MATYTPNLNLGKPDSTDPFGNFRQLFNDNMDKLDQSGGGGSSTLAGLSDVSITTPVTNDALIYDGAEWANSPLSAVAFSGDYTDLTNTPTIPTKTSDLNNDSNFVSDASYVHTDNNFTNAYVTKLSGIQAGAEVNVQANWNEADSSADGFIKNKPTIPAATSELTNDSGFVTDNPTFTEAGTRTNIASGESFSTLFGKIKKFFSDLKTVAFTGSYNDLSNKPTIPTVNNATLTIQKNGSSVATFTANASSNVTANISVPTKTSQLTNNSNFVVDASYVHTDNNYTNADVTKLSGIESGAEVNVQSDWNEANNTADDYIKNKPTIPTKTSDLNNDSGFLDSSDITITRVQTTGTKIATIDVDGNSTDLYAPAGGSYTAGDGIKIASNVISLEYFSVVNGAVNITFDNGN